MAKSVEQRTKELEDEVSNLTSVWSSDTAAFRKELDAPIFKKNGDVASLARRFDTTQLKFLENDRKKDDAKKFFDTGMTQVDKLKTQGDGLRKELDDIVKDEGASRKMVADAEKVEDLLNNWEETLKAQQDMNKERKAIFDNLMKVYEGVAKVQSDTISKVKKEVDAAKAGMNSANSELNSLEAQIRAVIVKYQKTALDMDRKDIADAVRGVLQVFGK
jgi:chromosome segregation ATPase